MDLLWTRDIRVLQIVDLREDLVGNGSIRSQVFSGQLFLQLASFVGLPVGVRIESFLSNLLTDWRIIEF